MTAVARGVSIDSRWKRGTRECELILRNALINRGTLCLEHDNRAMPFALLDEAALPVNGGAFQIAGADSDGGLRVFGRRGFVRFAIVTGGTTPTIAITYGINGIDVTVTQANTTAAAVTVAAVRAHALASQLIGIWYTGNGGGVAGTQAVTLMPHIRILGISSFDIDNRPNPTTDMPIPVAVNEFQYGDFWLLNDETNQLTNSLVPGIAYPIDNITCNRRALQSTVFELRSLELTSRRGFSEVCIEVP